MRRNSKLRNLPLLDTPIRLVCAGFDLNGGPTTREIHGDTGVLDDQVWTEQIEARLPFCDQIHKSPKWKKEPAAPQGNLPIDYSELPDTMR